MATHDAFWTDLDVAKARILECLADRGVTRVEYVVGFGQAHEEGPWVWLATDTDATRGLLNGNESVEELIAAVFSDLHRQFRGVVVESQETVDREYEGS